MTYLSLPVPRTERVAARGTLRAAVLSQVHVLHALMLHDIKSRFFGNGWGYVVTILWPGAHIAIIVIAHTLHKEMPYGDSALVYTCTGVLPYIAWNYISRFTMTASIQNKAYRQYPIVTPLDIMIARECLEIVSLTIITISVITIIYLCGANPIPAHPGTAALGLASAILLGIGFGIFNGTIASMFPLWQIGYILVLLGFYFTSGVILLNPENLPSPYCDWLSWNPLLHSVEWIRIAYYDDYPHRLLSQHYVIGVGAGSLVCGLVIERIARHFQ